MATAHDAAMTAGSVARYRSRIGWLAVVRRRTRELAPGARKVILDFERLPGGAPIEVGADDLRDACRDGRAAIGKLLGQAGAAREDVVEGQRHLVADRPRDLCLEERAAGDERPQQV